jgi:hypothetical protein
VMVGHIVQSLDRHYFSPGAMVRSRALRDVCMNT